MTFILRCPCNGDPSSEGSRCTTSAGQHSQRIVDVDPFALKLDFLFPGARLDDSSMRAPCSSPITSTSRAGDVLLGIQSFLLRTAT